MFLGRDLAGKLWHLFIQVPMVERIHDFAIHDLLELLQVHYKTGASIHFALHRHFQSVIVSVAMRIIALAEEALVLLCGKFRVVIIMRGRKFRPPRQIDHLLLTIYRFSAETAGDKVSTPHRLVASLTE